MLLSINQLMQKRLNRNPHQQRQSDEDHAGVVSSYPENILCVVSSLYLGSRYVFIEIYVRDAEIWEGGRQGGGRKGGLGWLVFLPRGNVID